MSEHRATALLLGLLASVLIFGPAGISGRHAAVGRAEDYPLAVRPWIGRTISDAAKQLGRPILAYGLRETGGSLVIFITPNNDRYVFETAPGGVIVDAVVKHPPGR